jgi:hypothetical protein
MARDEESRMTRRRRFDAACALVLAGGDVGHSDRFSRLPYPGTMDDDLSDAALAVATGELLARPPDGRVEHVAAWFLERLRVRLLP